MARINDWEIENLLLNSTKGDYYEIRLSGRPDPLWSEQLEGFIITPTESGEIILYGPFADQAALHGFISSLRHKDLILISVRRIPSGDFI